MALAEVVDGDPHAEPLERVETMRGGDDVAHDGRLRELEHEQFGGQPEVLERELHLADEGRVGELVDATG